MKEMNLSTYKNDGGEVLKKAQILEQKEILFRKRYTLGLFLKENGVRGIWAGYETGCFGFILHGALRILILVGLSQIIDPVLVLCFYILVHMSAYFTGVILEKVYFNKLSKLDCEISDLKKEYQQLQYKRYGMTEDGLVVFDNGIVVGNGVAGVKLGRDYGDMKIFHIEDSKDFDMYLDETSEKNMVDLNKSISSVQFKETFGVVAHKDKLVPALAYLSPSMQVTLMKNEKLLKIHAPYHINGDVIEFDTDSTVLGTLIYLSLLNMDTNLYAVLDDIDRYCCELIEMSTRVEEKYRDMLILKDNL